MHPNSISRFTHDQYRHFSATAVVDATIVAPLIFAQVPGL